MSERIVTFILDSRIANNQGVATLIYCSALVEGQEPSSEYSARPGRLKPL